MCHLMYQNARNSNGAVWITTAGAAPPMLLALTVIFIIWAIAEQSQACSVFSLPVGGGAPALCLK